MKKITLKLFIVMCLLGTYIGFSQTVNQNASWPNVAWTVTGTYNADPNAFEADPTLTSNFAFDDDDAGGSSDDDIAAESPVIDLTAANGAGETWLTVTTDYTYNFLADILTLEYWDADGGTWVLWQQFTDDDNSVTDNFCSGVRVSFTSNVLDIASFTATQLAGFRYRISFLDDGGAGGAAWEWGFCFDSPTITSAAPPACLDPSMLTASNITDTTADLGWTENGTATLWDIEIVDITAGGMPTGTATVTGVTNPYTAMGLTQDNDYEYYVLADCGGSGTSNWVGPFAFRTLETCPTPSALTATNIMETTADLGWTENGVATMWDVEVVTSGSAATGTPTASGVGNPYTAMGLTANTAYDFYVRADCGVGGTSNWAGPFTFNTACPAVINAPYLEDFEAFTTQNDTAFTSGNCWTGSNSAGSYFWESAPGTDNGSGGTGPDPSITTGNYFYTEASGSTTGDTADLVSPLVDLTALTSPALTFDYHMYGALIGTLDVIVNGTDNVWTLTGQQQGLATDPWETATINLAAYAGQQITVTFRGTGAGSFEGDISIDNVSFTELPACPVPSMLTVTNITDTTADLGWTENGTATVWDVEIVDVTAGGMATGTATASGVTNPYTAMGLTQNNDYAFYVRSDCGGSTSTWAGPFSFTTLETCPAPSGLNVTNITETEADLGWTENGGASVWNIEIVDITAGGMATGTPTASGVSANPYTASGLVGDNNYEFYVQADCEADGTSAWAGPFAFSTTYVAVAPDCTNGIFLDSGGNSGDHSVNENITYTICPDMMGDGVNVEFTFFSLENNGATGCWDELTIYDGPDTMSPTVDSPNGPGWCWDRNDAPSQGSGDLQGMTITSTDATGCLTFVFTSDGSVTRPGWSANVTCTPLSVESAEVRGFIHYVDTVNNTFVVNAQSTINAIEVYNLTGQIITTAKPNAAAGEANLGSVSNGVYFARVTLENGRTSVVKFVK